MFEAAQQRSEQNAEKVVINLCGVDAKLAVAEAKDHQDAWPAVNQVNARIFALGDSDLAVYARLHPDMLNAQQDRFFDHVFGHPGWRNNGYCMRRFR